MTVDTPTILAAPISRRTFEFSRIVRGAGYVGVILALAVAAATFLILMGLTPLAPTQYIVLTVLIVNGGLVLFLIFVIGWEFARIVMARRRGRAAARLHIRIVTLFSVVAAVPAILVAVVASVTLDRGLDNWFSIRTRAIVDTSATIAQAYVDREAETLDKDIAVVKGEIERARPLLLDDPDRFQTFLSSVAASRSLPGVFLVKSNGSAIAQAEVGSVVNFPPPPPSAITQAKEHPNEASLIAPGSTNMIGGIAKLDGYDDVFLYALRPIDPKIIRYLQMTTDSVNEYNALESMRFGIQLAFGILYLGVALVVLLSAIWLGIAFANRLVAPIRRLIDAAKQVSLGNLAVNVPARRSEGDLGALSDTFNTMTAQLRTQRQELLLANEQIDSRRRFTEAVLSGVTAGVIGIDSDGRVKIANRTALRLLGAERGLHHRPAGGRDPVGAWTRRRCGAPRQSPRAPRPDLDQSRRPRAHHQRPCHHGERQRSGARFRHYARRHH